MGFQRVVGEFDLLEDLLIRVEDDPAAGLPSAVADDFHFAGLLTPGIGLAVDLAAAHALHLHKVGKCVYDGCAYAVQTTGYLVSSAAELAAGVQHRHDDFHGGFMHLGMLVHRHASAVVQHLYAVIFVDGDLNIIAIARQRFVHGVVHDLVDTVMKSSGAGRTDIHARTFSDRVKTFQHLDLRRVVIAACTGCLDVFCRHKNFPLKNIFSGFL